MWLTRYANIKPPKWAHWGLVLLFCFLYALIIHSKIGILTSDQIKGIVGGDSGHYIRIAKGFYSNGWSMEYLETLHHRQPLYPLLLSWGLHLGLETPLQLLWVNGAVLLLSFVSVYFFSLWLFKNFWASWFLVLCWSSWYMVLSLTTTRLLTEPLFCVLLIHAGLAMLAFFKNRAPLAMMLLFAVLTSLSYQVRPNGLFVFVSGFVVMAIYMWRPLGVPPKQLLKRLFLSGCLFLLFSSPTLAAKFHYHGNPVYHGYLSNYLWAESYEEGHQKVRKITVHDFLERNTVASSVYRFARGMFKVTWGALVEDNRNFKGIAAVLVFLALFYAGFKGNTLERFYGAWLLLSLVLIAWSFKSNPVMRIPHGQALPLGIVLLPQLLMRRVLERSGLS